MVLDECCSEVAGWTGRLPGGSVTVEDSPDAAQTARGSHSESVDGD
jgi:hypothetical protein